MSDMKISQLPTAGTLADGNEFPLVQAGDTKKSPLSALKTFLETTAHYGNLDIHRVINDSSTLVTDLWSAYKINQEIQSRAAGVHTHDAAAITSGILGVARGGTGVSDLDSLFAGKSTVRFGAGIGTAGDRSIFLYSEGNGTAKAEIQYVQASGSFDFKNAAGNRTTLLIATPTLAAHAATKGYVDGIVVTGFPSRYMNGPAPQWVSNSQVKIPAGFVCRDVANTVDITFSTDVTVDITASGANGLDTGSEASNTWYYLYAISNTAGTTVGGLLSTVNEKVTGSITLPSGYTKKRQLPIAVRNNGSSNFIAFDATLIGSSAIVMYRTNYSFYNGSSYVAGTITNVLSAGTATTDTAVSCASFVPGISERAYMHFFHGGNVAGFAINRNGGDTQGFHAGGWDAPGTTFKLMTLDASKQLQYRRTGGTGTLYADVDGYVGEV